ncbi:MAG: hypothetical protein AAFV88_06030 [Planctomycetota bacterium]
MSSSGGSFLPKLSLLQLIGLVTVCAMAMGIVQQAVMYRHTWAVLGSVVVFAACLPAVLWMVTYTIAHVLSAAGGAVLREEALIEYQPTTRMPGELSQEEASSVSSETES